MLKGCGFPNAWKLKKSAQTNPQKTKRSTCFLLAAGSPTLSVSDEECVGPGARRGVCVSAASLIGTDCADVTEVPVRFVI